MASKPHLIGGEWVESREGQDNVNPSDLSDHIGKFAQASAEQTRGAIAAARAAQPDWYGSGLEHRYGVLLSIGRELIERAGELGRELAQLHRVQQPQQRYGFDIVTYCGALAQENDWCDSWAEFFVEHRLRPQFRMARANGFAFGNAERVLNVVRKSLPDHPHASLVHGDLWSGNSAFVEQDDDSEPQPCIFDPAGYIGDREVDLAMTHFFGGYSPAFYEGYEAEWPLDKDYSKREPMLNLFHALNHLNIFGGGYFSQCKGLIKEILANPDAKD